MLFEVELGLKKKTYNNIKKRIAVRALIMKNNNILMVKNNKGDYKFPGGGTKPKETYKETVIREVKEETGYNVTNVGQLVGKIIERNTDIYDNNLLFEMTSYYYFCSVSSIKSKQCLDDYEAKQNFSPVWINLNKVIELNEEVLIGRNEYKNPWVYRETTALKEIRKNLNNIY